MAKRIYTEEDRAAVYLTLEVNKGAVAPTSRDTGVPEATVRDWKNQFKTNPPDITIVEEQRSEFIDKAEQIRDELMSQYFDALRRKEVKPDRMPVHIGIFVDKIQLLRHNARDKTEARLALPTADEAREMFKGLVAGALDMARERDQDIIDYVDEEQPKGLPAPSGE